MVEINVNGIDLCGLIDTGASRSLLNDRVSLVGVSNNMISARVTQPIPVTLREHLTGHSIVLSPHSPCNLLGRDLLSKMGVTIALSPDKTVIDILHRLKDEATDLLFMPLLVADMEGGIPEEAKQKINSFIWVTGANTPGLMKVAPVWLNRDRILPVPKLPQYPLSPESVEGIKPVIGKLLQEGVLTPCRSSANTTIYPVPKPIKTGEDSCRWRLVHDLRAINKVIIPSVPVVPNPSTILATIPPSATHFTVINLVSAFFSVPVHPDDQ